MLLAYMFCGGYLVYLIWQVKSGKAETRFSPIYRRKDPINFWLFLGLQIFVALGFLIGSLIYFIKELLPRSSA